MALSITRLELTAPQMTATFHPYTTVWNRGRPFLTIARIKGACRGERPADHRRIPRHPRRRRPRSRRRARGEGAVAGNAALHSLRGPADDQDDDPRHVAHDDHRLSHRRSRAPPVRLGPQRRYSPGVRPARRRRGHRLRGACGGARGIPSVPVPPPRSRRAHLHRRAGVVGSPLKEVRTMNPEAAIGLLRCTPLAEGGVRQVALPPAARLLSTLSRIDYEDAFLVETGPAQDRTGEQWARAILEDAPVIMRSALASGWSALGLQLDSTRSERFVLGWEGASQQPGLRAPWCQLPPRPVGRSALQASAANGAFRHLPATGEPPRTRRVGRSRARTSTGRAVPPRAGQLAGTAAPTMMWGGPGGRDRRAPGHRRALLGGKGGEAAVQVL